MRLSRRVFLIFSTLLRHTLKKSEEMNFCPQALLLLAAVRASGPLKILRARRSNFLQRSLRRFPSPTKRVRLGILRGLWHTAFAYMDLWTDALPVVEVREVVLYGIQ